MFKMESFECVNRINYIYIKKKTELKSDTCLLLHGCGLGAGVRPKGLSLKNGIELDLLFELN